MKNKEQLISEIKKLRTEKNAVILAHYYVDGAIQDVADFVGDSLALSQQAATTKADIIVFAGVHFMAETAKILSPEKKIINDTKTREDIIPGKLFEYLGSKRKIICIGPEHGETAKILSPETKILIPDLRSGCPLADSMPTERFKDFLKDYPDHTVITYVNATAEIKVLSDITCTSSNAKKIVESLPKDAKIIFGPDKNLGGYINSITGRKMILWDGFCPIHENFSAERLLKLKEEYPNAKVLAHPECNQQVLEHADVIGSTSKILSYSNTCPEKELIIATEPGILHFLNKNNPEKTFIPVPPKNPKQKLSICVNMKKHSIEKVYECLKNESPEVNLEKEIIEKANKSITRMLEIS